MADRRRINGPVGMTYAPTFAKAERDPAAKALVRTRPADLVRKIYLQTGVTPSASGSAYLELGSGSVPGASGLKLSCTVHGPHALPRSTPFSPHLILSTHVKYAPFATKERRGYQRDTSERDLAVHLETSLRGAIIGDRWPKSGVDIVVSVIEADQDRSSAPVPTAGAAAGAAAEEDDDAAEMWGMMNVLSGCITVASAALADAGIDCVDTVSGGVAAVVAAPKTDETEDKSVIVVDPVPAEHGRILAACCVAYLPNRDEVTNLWLKGSLPPPSSSGANNYSDDSEEEDGEEDGAWHLALLDKALYAARQADEVLVVALKETVEDSS